LLALSTRAIRSAPAETEALAGATADDHTRPVMTAPPADLACRDLVRLVSDYLDGELPPDWRASINDHLSACDGCTNYLEQIRQTVVLLEQIDPNQRRSAPATADGNTEQADTGDEVHP
jgi:hypothetical protein